MTEEERTNLNMHVFIQWLAHKGMLDEWLTGCLDRSEGRTNAQRVPLSEMVASIYYDPHNVIDKTIVWGETSEGWQTWADLCGEWRNLYTIHLEYDIL